MKYSPLSKAKPFADLRTSYSHSNLDNNPRTPLKTHQKPQFPPLTHKTVLDANKPKKIPAKMGTITYKCGCTGPSIKIKPSGIPTVLSRLQLSNKSRHSSNGNKIKASLSTSHLRASSNKKPSKPKEKSCLKKIFKRINSLCEDYDDLLKEDTERSHKFSVIKYVPKEIIRSVDKIRRVDVPVEKKVIKVKKIPKEIIKYQQVLVEVKVVKEELKFVDAETLPPNVQYVDVEKEEVKLTQIPNTRNKSLHKDLVTLRGRANNLNNQLNTSQSHMQLLKESLSRAKSMEPVPPLIQPMMILSHKIGGTNESMATTTMIQSRESDNLLIRSKSQPLRNSAVLTFKSKLFINGREDESAKSMTVRSIGMESPRSLEMGQFGSSPQLGLEQMPCLSVTRVCGMRCEKVCRCAAREF